MPEKLSKEKLKNQAQRHLRDSKQFLAKWRKEAREAYEFVAGRQFDGTEESDMKARGKVPVSFNRLGPMIRAAVGIEINNRQEVTFLPRTVAETDQPPDDDRGVAETLTAAVKWVREETFAEFHDTAAHRDALICGLGGTEHGMDFAENPDGDPTVKRFDPIEIYYDASARQFSLIDRQYDFRIRRFSNETFKATFPGFEGGFSILGIGVDDPFEGEAHDQDRAGYYEQSNPNLGDELDERRRLVADYQYWRLEPAKRVVLDSRAQLALGLVTPEEVQAAAMSGQQIPERLEMVEDGKEFDRLESALTAQGLTLADIEDGDAPPNAVFYARTRKKVYYRAFISGDDVMRHFRMPEGQFTRNYVTGEQDRNMGTFFGLVRPMRDPQKWSNKFFSEILFVLTTNGLGGIMYEDGAFVNETEALKNISRPDAATKLTEGALTGGRVQFRNPVPYPTGLDQLMQIAMGAERSTTGFNLELLGLAERQQAGVVESQRKVAGMTILAPVFDSLRIYRRNQGRILEWYIRNRISDGRLMRIVGPDNAAFVPLLKVPDTMAFDIVVDDSPTSPNQKREVWQTFLQLLPVLTQLPGAVGAIVPFLDYLPFPNKLVRGFKEAIQQALQPDPRAEEAREIGLEGERMKALKDFTTAVKNMSQAEAEGEQTEMEGERIANEAVEALAKLVSARGQLDRANASTGGSENSGGGN